MKMKRNWLMIGLLVLALLVVTACNSTESTSAVEQETETPNDAAQDAETTSGDAEQAEVPAEGAMRRDGNSSTQLILGSFQLEDTEYAISTEQAETLLPLWKGYRALIGSDTASSVEQTALVNQIAEVFTSEQLDYLSETVLSPEDMAAMMEELGIESQFGGMGRMGGGGGEEGPEGDANDAQRAEMQALREANGGQGGGPGGGTGGGTEMDPEQLATMQAERAANGGGAQGNTQDELFLPALIELLEEKING